MRGASPRSYASGFVATVMGGIAGQCGTPPILDTSYPQFRWATGLSLLELTCAGSPESDERVSPGSGAPGLSAPEMQRRFAGGRKITHFH